MSMIPPIVARLPVIAKDLLPSDNEVVDVLRPRVAASAHVDVLNHAEHRFRPTRKDELGINERERLIALERKPRQPISLDTEVPAGPFEPKEIALGFPRSTEQQSEG